MWRFLNSILVSIIGFIHWLVFVKLTNWEKENMRQMGLESREEQNELLRQRLEGEFRHIQIGPEQEAEFLRRFPEVSQVSGPFEGDHPLTASLRAGPRGPSTPDGNGFVS